LIHQIERILAQPHLKKHYRGRSTRKIQRIAKLYSELRMYEVSDGKNGPLDHFGPILIDKANGLVI